MVLETLERVNVGQNTESSISVIVPQQALDGFRTMENTDVV